MKFIALLPLCIEKVNYVLYNPADIFNKGLTVISSIVVDREFDNNQLFHNLYDMWDNVKLRLNQF